MYFRCVSSFTCSSLLIIDTQSSRGLWCCADPMIGADDRNQFEMIRAMPGGVKRLKALGDELHARGIRGLWPLNPWDYGTAHNHSMAGRSFFTFSLADLISESHFDGFFGDTMGGITEDYYQAGLTRHNQSIAMEPEAFHLASNFSSNSAASCCAS